jgi:hypothetical protein
LNHNHAEILKNSKFNNSSVKIAEFPGSSGLTHPEMENDLYRI